MANITLTEDDIDDFNTALSLAYVGSNYERPGDTGDSGEHLKNLCNSVSHLLCNIRNRHTSDSEFLIGCQS